MLTTLTARKPKAAVGETETLATKLVGDSTVVVLTVMPAPKVARVLPAANAEFGEPVIRTFTLLAPTAADATPVNVIPTTSSDLPALVSPLAALRTLSAAVPIGNPAGTVTVRRRSPVAALSVVIAEAVAAWEILSALLDKLGGDTIEDTVAARDRVVAAMASRLAPSRRRTPGKR